MNRPLAVTTLFLFAACSTPADSTGLLNGVVWMQTAAEREAACVQTYAVARAAVLARAAEPSPNGKPYAVIVDVDETVLDNAAYQARLVRDQRRYDEESWRLWCERAQAGAIPGAVDFARACHDRGVTVFYVTNRKEGVEAATRRNLANCGFPLDDRDGVDVVLTQTEKSSSKQARRDLVAAAHEVVALVGDDLNDFVDAEGSVAQRRLQVRRHAAEWGVRWFVVPNPMYGSWERAVIQDSDPVTGKFEALSPWR